VSDVWLRARLEEVAEDLGRIRRCTNGDTHLAWRLERLAGDVWWLVAAFLPTAADLIKDGHTVDEALRLADQDTRRLSRMLGDPVRPQ
jgi:hypothetical protein